MITLERASPGRSTPVQKLSVPKRTLSPASRNASSIRERERPAPRTMRIGASKRYSIVGISHLVTSAAWITAVTALTVESLQWWCCLSRPWEADRSAP